MGRKDLCLSETKKNPCLKKTSIGSRLLSKMSEILQPPESRVGSGSNTNTSNTSSSNNSDCCYRVTRVLGKGLGAVAERDIQAGDVVITEEPFITLNLSKEGDLQGNFDPKTGEFKSILLDQELRKLSDNQLKTFYALSDAFRHRSSDLKTNFGIVKTNCFSVTTNRTFFNPDDPDLPYQTSSTTRLVLFPRIARINHSCLPNCHHYWSNQQGKFVVRAVQTIQKGEEICISYMSPLQRADFHTRDCRRKILQDEFGFHCCCSICGELDELKVAENDRMRKRVLEIEEEWTELGANPSLALSMGEEQLSLCSRLKLQSGLMSYVALHCVEAAALMVNRAGEKDGKDNAEESRSRCVDHAMVAVKHGHVAYGEHSEEMKIFRQVADICQQVPDQDLLGKVQQAITALRDIDS